MTTFVDLRERVYEITARPQLVALTTMAIAKATMEAHHVEFFPRDRELVYLTYTVDPDVAILSVPNIYTPIPRLRGIESVLGLAETTDTHVEIFTQRDYSDFYHHTDGLVYSVWDVIGSTLKCTPAMRTGRLELVVYQNPVITELQYSSWIADLYMEFVAQWAAMHVQARSGAMEAAQAALKLHVEPFKELLIESHLLSSVS